MADGKNRQLWDHTSVIAAAARSAMARKMMDPAKMNPYRGGGSGRSRVPITAGNIDILKTVFIDGKGVRT